MQFNKLDEMDNFSGLFFKGELPVTSCNETAINSFGICVNSEQWNYQGQNTRPTRLIGDRQ